VKRDSIKIVAAAAGLAVVLAQAGCSKSDGNNDQVRVIDGASGAVARGPMGDEQIRAVLAGKSFQYTGAEGNGIVTYSADGTSEYQDDTKGTLTGSWRSAGGQLCESLNPSTSLPDGRTEVCAPFSNTGDAYYAGKVRLVAI
jgi:hypothetical protein